jgi:ribonucleoside-triphosphate reductase (formate)
MSDRKCDVEVFSRVTGFFRPVQSWNKGKTEEFTDRKRFKLDDSGVNSENDSCRSAEAVSG